MVLMNLSLERQAQRGSCSGSGNNAIREDREIGKPPPQPPLHRQNGSLSQFVDDPFGGKVYCCAGKI